ncbi:MAG: hypothetical protein NZM37_05050 [Sandaracinaceae bacterium]|nr:hypothetical protein [Sandaracinaceae bacterium]MDW8246419.1 hypothetical protein [Sandaracinaceae bacterium]
MTDSSPLKKACPIFPWPYHVFFLFLGACGSGKGIVVRPMGPEEALLFDNGVDLIQTPNLLQGNWLESWEQETEQRVKESDLIAVVRIDTFSSDVSPSGERSHRLHTHIEAIKHGHFDKNELDLVVRAKDPGEGTLRNRDAQLVGKRFVAFIRWFRESPESPIVPRFHLSPASDPVLRRINSLVERYHLPPEKRRRVIVKEESEGKQEAESNPD